MNGSGKVTDAVSIRECNRCREVCIAILHILHELKDAGVTDRIQHICGIRAGKSLQCIDGKTGVINNKRGVELVIRILCLLPGDNFYIIRTEFRNFKRHLSHIKNTAKEFCNLPCLIEVAGNHREFQRYLPRNSISCSRAITSSAPGNVSAYPDAKAVLSTSAYFGAVLSRVWYSTWISTPRCSISEFTCASPKSISKHAPSLSRRIMLLVVRSPCIIPEVCNLPTIWPALWSASSVRSWVRSFPVTCSMTIVSSVISLITGVGTPALRAAAMRRASARVRSAMSRVSSA